MTTQASKSLLAAVTANPNVTRCVPYPLGELAQQACPLGACCLAPGRIRFDSCLNREIDIWLASGRHLPYDASVIRVDHIQTLATVLLPMPIDI